MTIWIPDLKDRTAPRYLAIADALGEDIDSGRLDVGVRLPTHRDLARRLGVTVGTVSRAYAEAERRGLVRGEVGRGTFVRGGAPPPVHFGEPLRDDEDLIDLGPSVPAAPINAEEDRILRDAFTGLARTSDLPALLDCQPHAGMWRHREAAALWLSELGFDTAADRVLITNGAQHAMAVTFTTLTRPGDTVMTEEVTFPGMKGLANLLHLRLLGLAMDADGLRPDAFERACERGESKVLYTIPTHQNPTATVMPEARRLELVEIARRHGVSIVEDDVYGFLPSERPPPFATLVPEIVYAIHSTSKVTVPGLRIGYLIAPEAMVERLAAGIWATAWMASPPMAEIMTRWIDDGTIHRFLGWRRDEAAARNEMAEKILRGVEFTHDAHGYFVWLSLPEPWSSSDFVALAERRGVLVSAPELFVAGRGRAPHAVRVSLAATHRRDRLEEGLEVLTGILREAPEPQVSIA